MYKIITNIRFNLSFLYGDNFIYNSKRIHYKRSEKIQNKNK